jgi:hypothetical protein
MVMKYRSATTGRADQTLGEKPDPVNCEYAKIDRKMDGICRGY